MALQWVQCTTSAPWAARAGHAVAVTPDGRIWVLGGCSDYYNTYYNDVWYSTDGVTWTQATSVAGWSQRADHTAVATPDGRIWVLGGRYTTTSGSDYYNDVWYSSDGVTWTQATSSASWEARADHTSVVTPDGRMWVILGHCYDDHLDDVWYSTDGTAWTQATAFVSGVSQRIGHASVVTSDGKIWIIGGYGSGALQQSVFYSSDGSSWTQTTSSAGWVARAYHAAAVASGKIWVLGGYTDTSPYRVNDVWYSTDGAVWTQDTSSAQWSGRACLRAAVVNDTDIYVIGGATAGSVYSDGFYYSGFLNDVWRTSESGVRTTLAATRQVVSNSATLTVSTRQTVTNTVDLTAAVKLIVEEQGVQRTFGVPVVTHRGHHILQNTVTAYGRLPNQFGEAAFYDLGAASVEASYSCLIEVNTETSAKGATRVEVSTAVESSHATCLAVGAPVTQACALRVEVSVPASTSFASRATIYNPVTEQGAARFEVSNPVTVTVTTKQVVYSEATATFTTKQVVHSEVTAAFTTRQVVGNPVEAVAGLKVAVGALTTAAFALRVDVTIPAVPVEHTCALRLEVSRPVALQAPTRQSVFNSVHPSFVSCQVVYTRVTYTAATQQRVQAVSPYAASYAVGLEITTSLASLFAVQVETAPTGKGEGTLEFTVIPSDENACVDVTAGECLTIERLPGQVKATYRGPNGPVELAASYSWQAGQELPVAFRWSRFGCALFVNGTKHAENGAPLLTGERLVSIDTGQAQYRNIRVSIRAREDWEIQQAVRAKLWPEDPDTLALALEPDGAKAQLLTPTVFTVGSLLQADLQAGLEYCLYTGETGWLCLDYDDSDWVTPLITYVADTHEVYVWPAANAGWTVSGGYVADSRVYFREAFWLGAPWERFTLHMKGQYCRFKAYIDGRLAIDATTPDQEYVYTWYLTEADYGRHVLAVEADATGEGTPGIHWNAFLGSGIVTELYLEASDEDVRTLGHRKPLWDSWKPLASPVTTVPANRALRLRAATPRVLRVLNWKDEDESIARVNLTPVGR